MLSLHSDAQQQFFFTKFLRSLGPLTVFAVSAFIAAVAFHVVNLGVASELSYPSKLLLMPLLLCAALAMSFRFRLWFRYRAMILVLCAGVVASWLGDGAAVFFRGLPELPMMLACFGLAHLCYIVVIWRTTGLAARGIPRVSAIYGIAYVALMIILWPHAGELRGAVLVYGLLLVATAVMTARCGACVAWGGASFLISDAVLSLRIFLPQEMPDWTNPLVMFTYSIGQGLIVLGILWRISNKPISQEKTRSIQGD